MEGGGGNSVQGALCLSCISLDLKPQRKAAGVEAMHAGLKRGRG